MQANTLRYFSLQCFDAIQLTFSMVWMTNLNIKMVKDAFGLIFYHSDST